jgi:hypothetical protein
MDFDRLVDYFIDICSIFTEKKSSTVLKTLTFWDLNLMSFK